MDKRGSLHVPTANQQGYSRVPAASGGPSQTPGEDRLSVADALLATEQAIQLDELIKWTKAQAAVQPSFEPRH